VRRTRSPHRRRLIALAGVLAAAGLVAGVGAFWSGRGASVGPTEAAPEPARPDALEGATFDPLQRARIAELRDFTGWLDAAGAEGFIGEIGWPAAGDPGWDPLGRYWYDLAEQEGLWTAAWAAGSHWADDYRLVAYGGEGSLGTAGRQGLVLERLEADREEDGSGARHGVNLAGLEFGTGEGFSAARPGALGTDYFAEAPESYAWLAGRGVDLVRLPVRWERLQPAPGAPFDEQHAALVGGQLDAAEAAGVDVILDLHNYGAHGADLLGSASLPDDRLAQFWLAASERWGAHPALLGYGLMNEPHDLGGGDERGAAAAWEATTQQVVTALREAGDEHLLLVAGYDWSSLARWSDNHPSGWIDDPADAFRYEAHHYWDAFGAGAYDRLYAEELSTAEAGSGSG
jgi:hypothetical protein